jgi:D-alanine transaminase
MAVAYINGAYRPLDKAQISIRDRAVQFGDGVYEVIYVHEGRWVDADLHLARLRRSLGELSIKPPVAEAALPVIIAETIRRNRLATGIVYIQVTRGAAPRDHKFPKAARPGLIVTAHHRPAPPRDLAAWAGAAITARDQRWARCDIKSVNLLANVLARQQAAEAGAYEAILIDGDGFVTEGAASNVWIRIGARTLMTRALSPAILPGCTRAALLDEIAGLGFMLEEQKFDLAALRAAPEIFLTGATSFVKPIVKLDGAPVGDGVPGPAAAALFERYIARMHQV